MLNSARRIYARRLFIAWLILYGPLIGTAQTPAPPHADLMDKLFREGQDAEKKANYPVALAKYEASLRLAEERGDTPAIANNWMGIGTVKMVQGDQPKAMESFRTARKIAEEINDKVILARALVRIGNLQIGQGQYREAHASHEKALQIGEETKNKMVIGEALMGMGLVHFRQSNYPQALAYYQRALQVKEELNDTSGAGAALSNIGAIYSNQGSYAQALDHFQKALRIGEERGDKRGVAAALNNIGLVYEAQGLYSQAIETHQKALRISEGLGDKSRMAGTLNNIGKVCLRQGSYDQAAEFFQRSLTLKEALGDRNGMAGSLNNLGLVYKHLGSYAEATAYFKRALKILEELGVERGVAATLNNIGSLLHYQGLYDEAIEHHQRALKINEAVGDKHGVVVSLDDIGIIYKLQGLYEPAVEQYQRALKMSEDLGDKHMIVVSLDHIGNVYLSQGAYEPAVEQYQRALKIAEGLGEKQWIASTLQYLGDARRQQGRWEAALEYYQRAWNVSREIRAKAVMDDALNGLGIAYLGLHKYAQAAETLEQALAIGEELKQPNNIWTASRYLARAYEKLGRPALALPHYQKAIEAIESVRAHASSDEGKAGFLQDKIDVYRSLVALLVAFQEADPAKGHHADAFHYVERARARALLDLMAESRVDVEQDLEPALLARQRAAHAKISHVQTQLVSQHSAKSPDEQAIKALESDLDRAVADHQAVQQEIRRRHPRYADLQYPQPIRLEALQARLDEKTLLLEYLLGEEGSFLFAVGKHDHRVARLPAAAAIVEHVQKVRAALADPKRTGLPAYRAHAQWLYRELVQPARGLLAGRTALIIVPDGILHYLPFEVLLKSDDARATQADWRGLPYLVRDYAISYAPSASVLASLMDARAEGPGPQKMFLAYADPAYGTSEREPSHPVSLALRRAFGEGQPWRLDRLPQSRREVERIAALYPSGEVSLFLGEQAREENVKAGSRLSQYRMIHFAVHGLLNERRPQFSGLVLSLPGWVREPGAEPPSPGSEDGLLQVYEIFHLKLQADLVVLSACETGLGREVRGEGLLGLTRAFLYAGTPRVAVSLWKVADVSTAELMVRFYRQMRDAQPSKAEALRQAQLELIRGGHYAHPYFWAPFVLIGQP